MELAYLSVEAGSKVYVYDSRRNESVICDNNYRNKKRELLLDYLHDENITDIVSMYEYVLPQGRSQLICWFRHTPTNKEETTKEESL